MRHISILLTAFTFAWLLSGCAFLDSVTKGGASTPTLAYQNAALLQSPSTTSLLSYFCPSSVGASICTPLLGATPAKQDLRFDFELSFRVDNPNTFDIPTLSMLLATTLFENDPDVTELGAACVKFCDPGDPTCTGLGAEDACAAGDQKDIDSLDDFLVGATDQLVNIANGDLDAAYADNLGIRTIPAQGFKDLKVVFSLGIDPMTTVLGRVAGDYVTAYVSGTKNQIDIPYNVRGTLWVDVPLNIGRVGLPFGPESSTWKLEM